MSSRMSLRELKSTVCSKRFTPKRSIKFCSNSPLLTRVLQLVLEKLTSPHMRSYLDLGKPFTMSCIYTSLLWCIYTYGPRQDYKKRKEKFHFRLTLYCRACNSKGERYPIFQSLNCFSHQSANRLFVCSVNLINSQHQFGIFNCLDQPCFANTKNKIRFEKDCVHLFESASLLIKFLALK